MDYPSFKWLNAQEIEYDVKVINKVLFKCVVVRVPNCPEDESIEELEKFVNRFAKQNVAEVYVEYPY